MTADSSDDAALLANWCRGEAAAAQTLYERHGAALLRFAAAMLASRQAAEDVVHDTFVELLRRPERFDAGGVFFAGPATGAMRLSPGVACAPGARKLPQSVPMGERTIDGIKTIGSSLQFTLAASDVGNEQPITVRSEQWFSPELRVVIASTNRDPMAGDTTYRLEQISRAEPDPSLFTAPADYTKTELPSAGTRVFGIVGEPR